MELRQLIAYVLMAVLAVAVITLIVISRRRSERYRVRRNERKR